MPEAAPSATGTIEADLGELVALAAGPFAFLGQNRPPARGFWTHPYVVLEMLRVDGPGDRQTAVTGYRPGVGRHQIADHLSILKAEVARATSVTAAFTTSVAGRDAIAVVGMAGPGLAVVVRQVEADAEGRLFALSVLRPANAGTADYVVQEALALAGGMAPLDGAVPPGRATLPFSLPTAPGCRVLERVDVHLVDPRNPARVLLEWSAWRDSNLDGIPPSQTAHAGVNIPVPSPGERSVALLGAPAVAVFGLTTDKPRLALLSVAAAPGERHVGMRVIREAVRPNPLKTSDPAALCLPLVGGLSLRSGGRPAGGAMKSSFADLPPPVPGTGSSAAVSHVDNVDAVAPDLFDALYGDRATAAPRSPPRWPGSSPPESPSESPKARPPARDIVAIDFGTTYTTIAFRAVGEDARVITLDSDGATRIPSSVLRLEDGTLVVGKQAENQAALAPTSFEPTPKRRIGETSIALGDATITDVDLVAAVLRHVSAELIRQRGGSLDADVWLTCPAVWQRPRQDVLREAAAAAGLGTVLLLPEPVAAAAYYASRGSGLPEGSSVAVYDLGGGTFDAAVVRRTAAGFEVAGPPGGRDPLGGVDFDSALFTHVGSVLAARNSDGWSNLAAPPDRGWRRHRRLLLEDVRRGKEALSTQATVTVYVPGVDTEVLVTAEEFNELVEPLVDQTVEILAQTVEAAGLTSGQLAAIYLVGGSSRIPLVHERLVESFGMFPSTLDDPKLAVVLGAASALDLASA